MKTLILLVILIISTYCMSCCGDKYGEGIPRDWSGGINDCELEVVNYQSREINHGSLSGSFILGCGTIEGESGSIKEIRFNVKTPSGMIYYIHVPAERCGIKIIDSGKTTVKLMGRMEFIDLPEFHLFGSGVIFSMTDSVYRSQECL